MKINNATLILQNLIFLSILNIPSTELEKSKIGTIDANKKIEPCKINRDSEFEMSSHFVSKLTNNAPLNSKSRMLKIETNIHPNCFLKINKTNPTKGNSRSNTKSARFNFEDNIAPNSSF